MDREVPACTSEQSKDTVLQHRSIYPLEQSFHIGGQARKNPFGRDEDKFRIPQNGSVVGGFRILEGQQATQFSALNLRKESKVLDTDPFERQFSRTHTIRTSPMRKTF